MNQNNCWQLRDRLLRIPSANAEILWTPASAWFLDFLVFGFGLWTPALDIADITDITDTVGWKIYLKLVYFPWLD